MEKNVYQVLQDWHELLKSGVITEEEFAAKKNELLGGEKKEKKLSPQEEDIRILTQEEQAQIDVGYDALFNNKTWFQKNKGWVIGVSIAIMLGVAVFYFTSNSSTNIHKINMDEKCNISGILKYELFYGPPGFGENPKEDKKEQVFILHLDKPIIVEGLEQEITTVQVNDFDNKFKLLNLINQNVSINCIIHDDAYVPYNHADIMTSEIIEITTIQ